MKVHTPKSLAFAPPPLFPALLIASLLGLLGLSSPASIALRLDNPTGFFTNVAARLLKSELNLDLNNLQVYPTNHYTPAVHRLLQVTANLYDCATNRTFTLSPEYPYCPCVFRPLFRRVVTGTNTIIVIAGYREVPNVDMADPSLAPAMFDLSQPSPLLQVFSPFGAAFTSPDKTEPMVSGIPLVIGAKKGFPNFNEFSMETAVLVTRLLELRRVVQTGPIVDTNQMYVVGISNSFGLEAWNSYSSAFPRPLRLLASAYITAVLTNETGVIFSNTAAQGASLVIETNSWNGWTTVSSVPASMVLPFGNTNSFSFLTNSTYINQPPWFVPQTHAFTLNAGFYVPHWWLNLSTRVLFILVDTAANRIVDYVNLNRTEPTVDITSMLASGNTGPVNPADFRNPANQWLTNQLGGISSPDAATYGVLNQITLGLNGTTDWLSFVQDPYAGLDSESAVDAFRYNFGFAPIYPKDVGRIFYRSNVFYAPIDPFRTIYVHTLWQANDPLVHYTIGDLLDPLNFVETNRVNFTQLGTANIGQINGRYKPWGGNPYRLDPLTDFQMAVKDPGISRSDDWNFPTNQGLSIDWVGRVHRDTPWQTIFLKSTNFLLETSNFQQSLLNWERWTGNSVVRTDWRDPALLVPDALFTAPTNDWHLVSLLNDFFNTNDVHALVSPNLATAQTWAALLDGMTVLTNSGLGQLTPILISSNSPQVDFVSDGLLNARASQPNQLFRNVGDVLATPELSVASPYLDPSSFRTLTDDVLEAIPAQLISRLRPDSIVTLISASNPPLLQFTGMDGYSYAVQVSSDLLNWTPISTNTPENGLFNLTSSSATSPQFYRSSLQP